MSPRRILVVIGHPIADSFDHHLAHAYADAAAAAGAEVRVRDLSAEPPAVPSSREQLRARPGAYEHLEPVVAADVGDLHWAEHITIVYPQWWGTYPAVLKSWIDRTFLAGDAFRYLTSPRWSKQLTGRTARLVMTMDSPGFYNLLVYRDAAVTALRSATLGYCGVKTIGVSRLGPIRDSSLERREQWLRAMAALGTTDGAVPGVQPVPAGIG